MKYLVITLLLISCAPSKPGVNGQDGQSIVGPQGNVGPSGVPGASITGPQGPVGAPGASIVGPQGVPGSNGSSCSVTTVSPGGVAPTGGAIISCTDGTSALVLNGSNGNDGTLVTPTQLCSGVSSYPTTFVEVAFCINNRLYGVYSDRGGFLTEVLQGTWSSNGINSSCTFTVGPNCQVTD